MSQGINGGDDDAVWHYVKDGVSEGPIKESTLRDLIQAGFLSKSDLVWRIKDTDWSRVEDSFEDLFPRQVPNAPRRPLEPNEAFIKSNRAAKDKEPALPRVALLVPLLALGAAWWWWAEGSTHNTPTPAIPRPSATSSLQAGQATVPQAPQQTKSGQKSKATTDPKKLQSVAPHVDEQGNSYLLAKGTPIDAQTGESIARSLYGQQAFNSQAGCYLTKVDSARYCAKFQSGLYVTVDGHEEAFAVISGLPVSEDGAVGGEESECHACTGFGQYVHMMVSRRGDTTQMTVKETAAASKGQWGSWDTVDRVQLIAVSPTSFAWLEPFGGTHQGVTDFGFDLYVPLAGHIANAFEGLPSSISDSDHPDQNQEVQFSFDEAHINVLYNLLLKINAKGPGQRRTFIYDQTTARYVSPKDNT